LADVGAKVDDYCIADTKFTNAYAASATGRTCDIVANADYRLMIPSGS
jgi:hypothetical protein